VLGPRINLARGANRNVADGFVQEETQSPVSNSCSDTAFIWGSSAKTRQVGNLCSRNPATEKAYRDATWKNIAEAAQTVRRKMVQKY
jgi:hypothetical protein